ncbi:PspA/IM30 family protein [Sinimarinibacterium sp. CAU 1509]|uniref:PspA/IM30 family protein n=1 Tax=Sinimarinibacterium sp. CAU 1509 TaxID=2562283 RepID=UPI0010ABBCC6|nr:PspA/IM30 family protein [Sinimarinibacterium sp. CAU 1509]TJY65059.1 PspA/IM30 family protein [Sinimarinibacterium sp. CAU 1509]
MNLMTRIRTMINAQAHQALDQAENPQAMAQQLLRELTEDLQRAQSSLVTALAAQRRLERERSQCDADADAWERKAAVLLKAEDEPNARVALERAVLARARGAAQDTSIESARCSVQRVRHQVDQLRRELEQTRLRAAQISASQTAAEASGIACHLGDHYSRSQARGREMERLMQRAGGLEATMEAASELMDADQQLDRAATAANLKADVDSALEVLKRRLQGEESA